MKDRDSRWRDDVTVTRMLDAGAERGRPVDALIARLESGASLEEWLLEGPARSLGDPKAMLLEGGASTERLGEVKDAAKAFAKERPEDPSGLATYFVALAAGLAHHGVSLSAVERERLDEVFLDLADAAREMRDGAWSGLLEAAVRTPRGGRAG